VKFEATFPCPTVRDIRYLASRVLAVGSSRDFSGERWHQLSILAAMMLPDEVLDKSIVDFPLLRSIKAKDKHAKRSSTKETVSRLRG
jgi:hypothetical protein